MENKKTSREWGRLVEMCLQTASANEKSIEKWQNQNLAIDRLPLPLGDELMSRLNQRKLLSFSLLPYFSNSVEQIDLSRYKSINNNWLESLTTFPHISTLKLADCNWVNDSSISHICELRRTLKELDLSRCGNITDAGIGRLVCVQSLEKLFVSHTRLTKHGTIILSLLTNLLLLDLGGIRLTDKSLSEIQVLTKLEHLDVRNNDITNNGAKIFKSFPKLKFLNISCTKITSLPFLPTVETLNFNHCRISSIFHGAQEMSPSLSKLVLCWTKFRRRTSEVFSCLDPNLVKFLDLTGNYVKSLSFLSTMTNLEHLNLSYSLTTNDMLKDVARVGSKLKYLNLKGTSITSRGIYNMVRPDCRVPNLEYLSLAYTGINDLSICCAQLMPSLKTLDLSNTEINGTIGRNLGYDKTYYSLYALCALPHLESLNLEDTEIQHPDFRPLSMLKNLKYLYLKDPIYEYSDMKLPVLRLHPNLEHLKFRSDKLNDLDLCFFTPPKSLNTLDLRGCPELPEYAIGLFHKKHPRVEVIHELTQSPNFSKHYINGITQNEVNEEKE